MKTYADLVSAMVAHEAGCPSRVHHFLTVHGFARAIGEAEGLDARTQHILETAALVHDIGIRPSLEKHGGADGKYQEAEGPAYARAMLEARGMKRVWSTGSVTSSGIITRIRGWRGRIIRCSSRRIF